jgi:hypothetical protein
MAATFPTSSCGRGIFGVSVEVEEGCWFSFISPPDKITHRLGDLVVMLGREWIRPRPLFTGRKNDYD